MITSDMKNNLLKEINDEIKEKYPFITIKPINISELIFEERVKMNCFYCGRYNRNWKCPPNIPAIDYQKMFSEYEHAAFVYLELAFNERNFKEIREKSSLLLHNALLQLENYLCNQNYPMALSFIGGSCKLCKNGCGKEKCNNPYHARTPLEATGVNVVESAKKYDIDIVFPPEKAITRLGLLLW